MAQDRRREQYGYDEGSWGEEDRRYRSGRYDDWQRRNDDMRRREWGQGRERSYGRGFEDYGRGQDAYGSGGDREVDAELGRGWGQGSYGQYGQGSWSPGGGYRGGQQDYDQAGQYGYGQSGGSGTGSSQQYGYGPRGWRGSGAIQDWQRGGRQSSWSSGSQYGGYGGSQYGGQGYGQQRGMWDRATDEVASWFGDDDAQRRREMDQHRGKGPKNYTRSDERIKEEVCDNLAEHPMVDASEIEVKVQSGEVTLDGTVHSRQQKRAVEDCVERISGIKHLQNNLRVQDTQPGAMGRMSTGQASTSGYGTTGSSSSSGIGSSRSSTTSGAGSTGSMERK